eukprot:PhF_6_TR13035/c0_g1_i1/m.20692/K15104/SLC25A11, OGC; solute carrier family 25 (mitochondrial oxoglutarate transporter), member 11
MSQTKYPAWMNFPIGTIGGSVAWCFVHPMDVVKVRMQVHAERKLDTSLSFVIKNITQERGMIALYDGLSAGISRQIVYGTFRLGLYDIVRDAIAKDTKAPNATERLASGAISGGVAAYLSCPVEIALVRMQADSSAPKDQRRGYKNVADALVRIAKEEGPLTYWRGSTPTVVRAVAVGITQVGFYDQCKAWLVQSGYFANNSNATNTTSSLLTGVFYSFVTMPIETVKIRMQNQKKLPDGTFRYKNLPQAMGDVVKTEGVKSLWRGYFPYYGRCAMHTLVCFSVMEKLKVGLNWAYTK